MDIKIIENMPITVIVEIGKASLSLQDLLALGEGSIIELESSPSEALPIYANGILIAKGEVVVVDDNFGIRVTDLLIKNEDKSND